MASGIFGLGRRGCTFSLAYETPATGADRTNAQHRRTVLPDSLAVLFHGLRIGASGSVSLFMCLGGKIHSQSINLGQDALHNRKHRHLASQAKRWFPAQADQNRASEYKTLPTNKRRKYRFQFLHQYPCDSLKLEKRLFHRMYRSCLYPSFYCSKTPIRIY